MSNLQTYYHFKLDFQKVDQHTEGKWVIHGPKRRKDNQLQSVELPCRIYHTKMYLSRSHGIHYYALLSFRHSLLMT